LVLTKRFFGGLSGEVSEQCQSRKVQTALDRLNGDIGYFTDVADAQFTFELQEIGFTLLVG
jgi:hypothetical protein